MSSPENVDFVSGTVHAVVGAIYSQEGQQVQPPSGLETEDSIMVVNPALDTQVQGRNEQTLEDQPSKDAMAHAGRFASQIPSG